MQKTIPSVTFGFIVAYAHEKVIILVSVLNIIFFLFCYINVNAQDFVYVDFVKYQLGNACISALQLFYIHACPKCLPISK